MKMRLTLAIPFVLLLAGTAAAQDVRYNFDKQANFAGFKTYKWVTIKGATQLADLADRQVKAAVDAELAKKGLTKSTSDTADLFIGYQGPSVQEKQYTSFDTGWGYGPGYYGGGWYGRRRRDDDGDDVHYLCRATGAGYVRLFSAHARVARRRRARRLTRRPSPKNSRRISKRRSRRC